jgi:uncharacterized protein (DUF952 family)
MAIIYHIAKKPAWDQAVGEGLYRGDTLASEGFIHCSKREQVERTAEKYYNGQSGLVLLAIDESRLGSPLRYELAPSGELFPHIYGPLERDAVAKAYPFAPEPDGSFRFPKE